MTAVRIVGPRCRRYWDPPEFDPAMPQPLPHDPRNRRRALERPATAQRTGIDTDYPPPSSAQDVIGEYGAGLLEEWHHPITLEGAAVALLLVAAGGKVLPIELWEESDQGAADFIPPSSRIVGQKWRAGVALEAPSRVVRGPGGFAICCPQGEARSS
ncbi:hypothetical protein ABID26_007016 [Mesorhizobium shonense]|uniref:Uncharacterized protein n=1 Tax=Mesorhizobium shonense TaxID=1209948 RepID=A0ABV2I3Z9_9HYPH